MTPDDEIWGAVLASFEVGDANAFALLVADDDHAVQNLALRACLCDSVEVTEDAGGNPWLKRCTAEGELFFRIDHEDGSIFGPLFTSGRFRKAGADPKRTVEGDVSPATCAAVTERWAAATKLAELLTGREPSNDHLAPTDLPENSTPGDVLQALLSAFFTQDTVAFDRLCKVAASSRWRLLRDSAVALSAPAQHGLEAALEARSRREQRLAAASRFGDPNLATMAFIRRLNASCRNIGVAGAAIAQYVGAESINLSGNRLERLKPELARLSNLRELDLSEHCLKEIPPELFTLPSLEVLRLGGTVSGGTYLSALPETIGQLRRLRVLDVSNCHLSELPAALGDVGTLTELDASGNNLRQLPESLGRLKNLATLDLRRNPLTTLPESMREATALRNLWLDSFSEQLPSVLGALPALRELSIECWFEPGTLARLLKTTPLTSLAIARHDTIPEDVA